MRRIEACDAGSSWRTGCEIVAGLKRESYRELKDEDEVARGPSLWTREFLASTESVGDEARRAFIDGQPAS